MLHVSSKEGPVETEVKGMITISCIIRKLYRLVIESCGGQGCIVKSIRRNFLFNRAIIPPRMREQGRLIIVRFCVDQCEAVGRVQ